MSTTPQDFEPPRFDDLEDTKTHVLRRVGEVERDIWRVRRDIATRDGSMAVVKWMLGVLIVLGASFFGWIVLTLTGVQGDVRALGAEMHARMDAQSRDIQTLQRHDDP